MKKRLLSIILALSMVLTLFPAMALAEGGLFASTGKSLFVISEEPVFIDQNISIEGFSESEYITGAKVMIQNKKTGDELIYVNANGINGTYDSTTGILSLVGNATPAQYQNALRSIKFSTTSNDTENRSILISLGEGLYYSGNNHFYEYISSPGITWDDAKTAAEGRRLYGRQGYLVTITSAEENAFVTDKVTALGWIGAKDINYVDISSDDRLGDWRWVTGPEGLADGGKGTQFYTGYSGVSGAAISYSNWWSGEPNNSENTEYVAHIFGPTSTMPSWAINPQPSTRPSALPGQWNDYQPTNGGVLGYVVEYGGMADDTPINIQTLKTVEISSTPAYPQQLVNGGFEYPTISSSSQWVYRTISSSEQAQFGWEKKVLESNDFEFGGSFGNVQEWGIKFVPEGTQFIELNADEQSAIYQDLSTKPGDIFYWSLYQGGVWYNTSTNIDNTMTVRIGTPEQLNTRDTMISTTKSTYDQSWTSRTIYEINSETVVSSIPNAYNGKDADKTRLYTEPKRWTKYEGIYVVPEGQTVTRFVFASLSTNPTQGNLLDGVVFRVGTEVELAKIKAKGVLITALVSYTQNNYSTVNWTALNKAKTDGDAAIEVATDIDGVTSAKTAAITAMAAIETLAQESADVLESAKTTAKTDITTALSGYNSTNYSSENWTVLNKAKTDGDTAIDAAADIAGVTTAKNAALAAMHAVKTLAEEATDAIAAAKLAAKGALATALGTYKETDYSAANWIALNKAKSAGDTAIDAAADLAGVTSAKATALDAMAAVKTVAFEPIYIPNQTPTTVKETLYIDITDGKQSNVISETKIERTTEPDGTKKDVVIYEELIAQDTVDKLKDQGQDIARILIPDTKDEVKESRIDIPKTTLDILSNGKVNLEIETENVRISIPKESIQDLSEKTAEDLYFNVVPIKSEKEKEEVENRVKQDEAVLSVTNNNGVSVIGRPMEIETNMSGRKVDIVLPLKNVEIPTDTKEREQFIKTLAVYVEHSDGDKELLKGEIVEYKAGVYGIKFTIKKFSTFTILKLNPGLASAESAITSVKLPEDAVIRDNEITKTFETSITKTKIDVIVSDKATWKLYKDSKCTSEITDNSMRLKVGENIAYIKVTAEDGESSKVYTIKFTRKDNQKVVKSLVIGTKIFFADGFAGEVLAAKLETKVFLLGSTNKELQNMVNYVTKNFKTSDIIYILGGRLSYKTDPENILRSKGYKNIVRIAGGDKYDTAKRIAERIHTGKGTPVVLVNGAKTPKDAEYIKNFALKNGFPILYVTKNSLTKYTEAAIQKLSPSKVYLAGDNTQTGDKLIIELQKLFKLKTENIIRIKK